MTGLAAVYGGSAAHHRMIHEPKYRRWLGEVAYLPDLAGADLTGCHGMLIPDRCHQGMLDRAAATVLGLLERGGTVVVFSGGEPPPAWLPGVSFERRPTNFWWWLEQGASLGVTTHQPDDSFWQRLSPADVAWHYHGALDPPAGARSLVGLDDGGSLLYVDETSCPGTLVVSSLDPIWHFGSYFMPATERFLDGFLPWVVQDLLPRSGAGS